MRRLILLLTALTLYASALPNAIVTTPKGYVLAFSATPAAFSPVDATTYYIGGLAGVNPTTSATAQLISIPHAGIVRRIDLIVRTLGTTGTTETSTISFRLNNTTDTTISAALITSTNASYVLSSSAIPVAAGDFFEIKWVTPTWATNPTTVAIYGTVYIDVP